MLENVTVLFTDSLSHFTAHPPLLFYFSIPLPVCVLWNHRFNKRRLRRKRITPSLWLYKTCLFHICCYNYIPICFYSQLFSFFSHCSQFSSVFVLITQLVFLFFPHFFPFIGILTIHWALKLIKCATPRRGIKESDSLIMKFLYQKRYYICMYLDFC